MPYIGSAVKSINTRSAVDHQQFLGSSADTITNPGYYTFYVNYSPGNISVFVAGNNISHTDYTANNGTDVRISTGTLTINPTDNVEIIGYNVPTSQVLERTEVNITGGTISNTTISNSNFIGVNNAQLSVGLPIVDSSGNTVISESGGTVTIANSVQLSADSVVSSSSHTFRNKIINGNFDIWQRGTSQTSPGYGSVDRFKFIPHYGGSGSISASRQSFSTGQTDVPGNPTYYVRNVVVAGTFTFASAYIEQRIENVRTLAGKKATLSFWAKADANKVIGTDFTQHYGTNGNGPPAGEPGSSTITGGIESRTYNVTTSWQKFTTTVDIPSNSGATFGADLNTDYLNLRIYFSMGSDSEVGTNPDYTPIYSPIRNIVGSQSGTFDIAQIQLEEGSVATPFEERPIGLELSLCQRYCYVISPTTGSDATLGNGSGYNSTSVNILTSLPVPLRSYPTLTVSGTWLYLATGATSQTSGATPTLGDLSTINPSQIRLFCGSLTGISAGSAYWCVVSNGGKLIMSSEL